MKETLKDLAISQNISPLYSEFIDLLEKNGMWFKFVTYDNVHEIRFDLKSNSLELRYYISANREFKECLDWAVKILNRIEKLGADY